MIVFARRAYCVGEAPENHVCPWVRVSVCVSVCPCVRTFLDPVSELESEDTSAISLKKGTKKGSKWHIWFQVRDRSRPKNNSNLVTFSHVIRFW